MRFTKLAAFALATSAAMAKTLPLRVVSFNIRYNATNLFTNEKPWADRKPYVVGQLKDTIARAPSGAQTFFGLQEVLLNQLQDIGSGLGSDWTYIGVGRDDGKTKGEYNPIFYRKSAVRLLSQTTKWLSPTPDVPSFGWDAGSRRMVNIGVFEDVETGERYIAANTHLDNASSEARSKGVQVVLDTIKSVQQNCGPSAVFLTGDFNSEPGEDAYAAMVDSGCLGDLQTTATASQRFGDYDTFTGFDPTKVDSDKKRIDFIWVGPLADKSWQVVRYEVLSNVKNDVYLSDHRAVVGDVSIVGY